MLNLKNIPFEKKLAYHFAKRATAIIPECELLELPHPADSFWFRVIDHENVEEVKSPSAPDGVNIKVDGKPFHLTAPHYGPQGRGKIRIHEGYA